jgi:hypothetical protein
MRRVLATRVAKLPRFQPVGMLFFVFGRRVISVFALAAL